VAGVVTVNPATTATTITSSLNPSNWGNQVILTATVAPHFSGVPSGVVNFYNVPSGTTCATVGSTTPFDKEEPVSPTTGQATTSNAWLPVGTNNILACYTGDTNFLASSGTGSSSTVFTQTVIAAPIATLTPSSLSFGNQQAGTSSGAQIVTVSNSTGTAPLSLSIGFTGATPSWFTETDNCGGSVAAGGSCTINMKFAPPLNGTGVGSAFLTVTDNNENVTGSTQTTSLIGAGLTTIADQSLYTNALVATSNSCGSITLSGGSSVDSFNSSLGFPASEVKAGGNVGTNGNITLNGNKSAIYGTAYAPAAATGNCNQTSMTGLTTSGGAQVTSLQQLSGALTYPVPPAPNPAPPTTSQNISGSCPSGLTGCTSLGSKSVALAPGQYGNLTVSGGTTVHLTKGTYNINSLSITGKSVLNVDAGPVVVNLAGTSLSGASPVMDLSGGSIQNIGIPANLQFTYAGSRGINLSGGSGTYATVYAPHALVNFSGGSDFFGSIVGSTITSSGGTAIHYDSNLPNIPAGDYIWFSAVVNNVNLNGATSQVKLYMTSSSISFTANGVPYTVPVPNAVVIFNSAALKSGASTSYDLTNSRWATSVYKSALTGNTFAAGVAFPVPAGGFPAGIQNVTWSAAFSTDTPGINLQWQWGAAVYTQFSSTYATTGNTNVLGVNPADGSANSNPPDPAGTPEGYKQFVVFGGTGGGLASYIGYPSNNSGVVPTIAPMSVSPSSYDFGSVTKGTPLLATTPFVLTNNDSVSYNISAISITGTNSGDFSQTTTCPVGGTLAAGASCKIMVTFTPSNSGGIPESAKVVVNDTAPNSPQTIYLTGIGQ
jgi:hypothetical protein